MNNRPTQEELDKYIHKFHNEARKEYKQRFKEARDSVQSFSNDFPISSLANISIDEYFMCHHDLGYPNNFCNRLHRVENSSMNQCRREFYGIFYDGYSIKMSPQLKAKDFKDVDDAYDWLLKEIISLLDAGKNHDIDKINENKVNSYVKCKLLSIYYPDDYLPMNSKDYVTTCLDALNISYSSSDSCISRSEKLREWKNSQEYVKEWDNIEFMYFCDVYFQGKNYPKSNYNDKNVNQILSIFESGDDYLSENVLFCSVTRMEHYKGIHALDPVFGGGKYISENGTGYEIYNFMPVAIKKDNAYGLDEGKYCFGFVEAGHTDLGDAHDIHIENIVGCEQYKTEDKLEDCLIIFSAPKYTGQGHMIVGWYNHATVLRHMVKDRPGTDVEGAFYFYAKAYDCVLLPHEERRKDSDIFWDMPQNKKGFSGRSGLWYANYTNEKTNSEDIRIEIKEYREQIIDKIGNYKGNNYINFSIEDTKKDLVAAVNKIKAENIEREIALDEKRHIDLEIKAVELSEDYVDNYVPQPEKPVLAPASKLTPEKSYVRDTRRSYNALRRAGCCCEYNPSHPSFVRKSDNTQYTEAHHLVPFGKQSLFPVSLDVEANIVSLCSNCHNQIHFGRDAEQILEKLYYNRRDELLAAGIKVEEFSDLLKYY